jgi:hypothetical protein
MEENEKAIEQLKRALRDAEADLARTKELYAREKIEKESNALALRQLLERYLPARC